jgi:hypothetical protein
VGTNAARPRILTQAHVVDVVTLRPERHRGVRLGGCAAGGSLGLTQVIRQPSESESPPSPRSVPSRRCQAVRARSPQARRALASRRHCSAPRDPQQRSQAGSESAAQGLPSANRIVKQHSVIEPHATDGTRRPSTFARRPARTRHLGVASSIGANRARGLRDPSRDVGGQAATCLGIWPAAGDTSPTLRLQSGGASAVLAADAPQDVRPRSLIAAPRSVPPKLADQPHRRPSHRKMVKRSGRRLKRTGPSSSRGGAPRALGDRRRRPVAVAPGSRSRRHRPRTGGGRRTRWRSAH